MEDALATETVKHLLEAEIDYITYLPETRLSQILPILEKENTCRLVPVASKAEAISIASGAKLNDQPLR